MIKNYTASYPLEYRIDEIGLSEIWIMVLENSLTTAHPKMDIFGFQRPAISFQQKTRKSDKLG